MTRVVSVATEDLPAEPEALRAFVLAMIAERDAAIAERDELATRNERLHALLNWFPPAYGRERHHVRGCEPMGHETQTALFRYNP